MYRGTLIQDLFAAVERAERSVEQKRLADEIELQRMYELVPACEEQVLAGAA